jgi:hypothetical protein
MPTGKVQFRERSVRRVIRAAQKEHLVAKSLKIEPDGTITLSLAEPARAEIPLDLSRQLDEIVENEWDHHGKPTT